MKSAPLGALLALTSCAWLGVVLSAGPCPAADSPPAPRPRLNKIDPAQLWRATRPAILEGRRPEVLEQLIAVFTDQNPSGPAGWYHPSQLRHDWSWLVRSFDANRDGSISPEEFGATDRPEAWTKLDRNYDNTLAQDDLDWSSQSAWVREDRLASQRFNTMDTDGNGRVSEEEWRVFFEKVSQGKDHITAGDLRENLFIVPPRPKGPPFTLQERWDRAKVILNGDIGSMFEGPRVDDPAPDFSLETSEGGRFYSLSEYRGKKPVVLIFGSFT